MSPLSGGPCNIFGRCSPASPPAATSALGREAYQSAFLMPLFQSEFLGEEWDGRERSKTSQAREEFQ